MEPKEMEAKMLARMGETSVFSFMDLYFTCGDGHGPEYRFADRLLQRERKAGRIEQVSRGVWRKVGA